MDLSKPATKLSVHPQSAPEKKTRSLHHWKDSHMKPNGVIHYDFNFCGLTVPLQKLAFVPRFSSGLTPSPFDVFHEWLPTLQVLGSSWWEVEFVWPASKGVQDQTINHIICFYARAGDFLWRELVMTLGFQTCESAWYQDFHSTSKLGVWVPTWLFLPHSYLCLRWSCYTSQFHSWISSLWSQKIYQNKWMLLENTQVLQDRVNRHIPSSQSQHHPEHWLTELCACKKL